MERHVSEKTGKAASGKARRDGGRVRGSPLGAFTGVCRRVCVVAAALLWAVGWTVPAVGADVAEGFAAYQEGDYERARDIWLPLAEAGDSVAQYNLGKLFEFGGGELRQDYVQAARWYREAAAQDVAAAQNNLGLMHAQGHGMPRDTARAAELWQVAAANGYALAQYNLGLAYFRGDGIRQDEVQAAAWFRRAAEGGLADAQFAIGQMPRTGRVVARDEAAALAWYRRAAAQGHAESVVEAGQLEGKGVVAARPEPAPEVLAVAEEEVLAADQPAMPPPPGEAVIEVQPAAEASDTAPVQTETGTAAEASDTAPVQTETGTAAEAPDMAPVQTEAGAVAEEIVATENGQVTAAEPQDQPVEAAATEETPASGNEPAVQTAAVPEADGYRVWLLSADSEEVAEELWDAALKRHETVLATADLTIREVDYGELGHFYRVLAGPVMDREAALGLCRRLRSDTPETFCKILRQ